MGIEVLDSSITSRRGVSALEVVYDCDFPEDQRTIRVWDRFLIKGRYTYLLEYVGLDETFEHDVLQFVPIMNSFVVK